MFFKICSISIILVCIISAYGRHQINSDYDLCMKSPACLRAIADEYDLRDLSKNKEPGGRRATELRDMATKLEQSGVGSNG